MSEKVLNKVNNDIFSYKEGVFTMSKVMPTEIHHTTAGVGPDGYILTSTGPNGNGWTWTEPSVIETHLQVLNSPITDPKTYSTGLDGNVLISKGSNVPPLWTNEISINKVTATNFICGSRTIVDAGAGCSFTALEIKPSTSGASETLLIDSDGDITCHGTLSIDSITRRDSTSTGTGVAIENVTIDGNVISALNYKCGSRIIVDAGAGCSFTALEIKPSTSGASETLLINSNGDITCHGTLSIDSISEKTTGSGITLSSVVKMTGIQSSTNTNKLLYDTSTGEITYQPDSGGGGGTEIVGTSLRTTMTGNNVNNSLSISLGNNAGNIGQQTETIAIGNYAASQNQGTASIAIGKNAGKTQQEANGIAIGNGAGMTRQGTYCIAIGRATGEVDQDFAAIAIGISAGRYNAQGNSAVAIGHNAGNNNQGNYAVALGTHSATNDQSDGAVSIGDSAGRYSQAYAGVGVGRFAGHSNQHSSATALGNSSGYSWQKQQAVAIGHQGGCYNQNEYSVAIGAYSGWSNQGFKATALGVEAAKNTQGQYTVAVGNSAGRDNQGEGSIAIGNAAGLDYQGTDCIAIGRNAGRLNDQGSQAVAIGFEAGYDNQGAYSVAIGNNAGKNTQAANSIVLNAQSGIALDATSTGFFVKPIRDVVSANKLLYNNTTGEITYQTDSGGGTEIVGTSLRSTLPGNNVNNSLSISLGEYAGNIGQLDSTVAIGASSGRNNQKSASTAVGWSAGYNNQGTFCTAIGTKAGYENQGDYSTAIGYAAGYLGLSANSIAIGHVAAFGPSSSLTNYIVINATGTSLEPASSNGFHVKPIRDAVSANKLLYNSTTGEITYQPDSGGGSGGSGGAAIDIPIPDVNYDFRDAQVSGNKITWTSSYGTGHHALLGGTGASLIDSDPDHVLGTSTSWISLHGALSIINNPGWSFEMYIKKNSGTQPGGYITFSKLGATSSDWSPVFSLEIEYNTTNLTAWWGVTGNYQSNELDIPELQDQWTHWTITYDGRYIKSYRNYSTSVTFDTSTGSPIPYYGFEEIKIGRTAWTQFDLVSEETRFVRFYSKALTDDEVNKLYINRDTEGPINSIYEPATTNPGTELKLRYPYKISELQGTTYNSKFGLASSMNSDGTRMAVGVPGSNLVKVYDWDGSTWNQIGSDLTFSSLAATEFGSDLEMNNAGNVVIVGDGSAYGNRGAVAIYEWNGSSWTQRGGDIISPYNGNGYFGRSVSISDDGSIIAVGCHNENMHGYYYSGRVYIYQWNGTSWNAYGDSPTQAGGNGSPSSVWSNGRFGGVVKLAGDGNSFITGQESGNNGSGKLWLFELQNGTWTTINITYPSYQTGWMESFGQAVSGTSDLGIIAVGIGGQNLHFHRSGSVFMLKRSGNDYVPYGSNYIIEGEGGQNDFFGGSGAGAYKNNLSLSSDGKTVAISSVNNEANYTASNSNVGQVRVYKYNEGYNGGTWSLLFKTLFGKNVSDYFGYLDLTPDGLRLSVGASQSNSGNGYLCIYDLTEYTTTKLSTNAGSIGVGNDVDLTAHESSHYNNDEIQNKSSDELKYGTQGQYLVSGGPSNPMKWISKPYASFVRPWDAPQFTLVANAAWTEINWTQVKFSSGIYLDSGGYHFRVIRSGVYSISVQCRFGGGDCWTGLVLLDKDEDYVGRGIIAQSAGFGTINNGSDVVNLNILAEINETQHCVVAFYRQDGSMTIINPASSNVGHQMVCNIICVS